MEKKQRYKVYKSNCVLIQDLTIILMKIFNDLRSFDNYIIVL